MDITPLRISPAYRRLWSGLAIANIGQQMTAVAVGLQVYDMTRSSLMVGLVGLFQLVPLVVLGLFGGTLSDAFDRRKVGIFSAIGLWFASVLFLAQSMLGSPSVWLLYGIVALHSAFFAIGSPARGAIIPRLVPEQYLPAANALGNMTWNVGFTIGPIIGGLVIAATGTVTTAYLIDVIGYLFAIWAMVKLPSLPPTRNESGERPSYGWKAVGEGLTFLRGRPVLQMSFYVDLIAMVFGMPRALFPAIAALWYGGTTSEIAFTVGLLSAGVAAGALISGLLSGPVGRVRRQGRAIVIAVIVWGGAITVFGLARSLPIAIFALMVAGAADNISAIFRATILQAATPDEYRGRLQGVFTVVVAGGPRLGDVEAGAVAAMAGEMASVVFGGVACIVCAAGLSRAVPSFWRYDAAHPTV